MVSNPSTLPSMLWIGILLILYQTFLPSGKIQSSITSYSGVPFWITWCSAFLIFSNLKLIGLNLLYLFQKDHQTGFQNFLLKFCLLRNVLIPNLYQVLKIKKGAGNPAPFNYANSKDYLTINRSLDILYSLLKYENLLFNLILIPPFYLFDAGGWKNVSYKSLAKNAKKSFYIIIKKEIWFLAETQRMQRNLVIS